MEKNEDYSPGDSISDSTKKLFQRGIGESQYIHVTLVKGNTCNEARIFCSFLLVSIRLLQSQGADITMKDFSAFLDMKRCKNWAHKIFS